MADRENNSVVMLAAAQQITCFKPFFRIDDFLKSLWFCVVLADLLYTHILFLSCTSRTIQKR